MGIKKKMSTILNRNDDPNIATRKDAGQHQNAAAAPKEHSENDVDKTPTNTKGRRNKRTQESADVKDKRKNELGNIKDKRTKKLAHNKSNPPQKQKQNNKGKADNLNKRNKRGDGSVKDKVSSTTVRRQSPSSETVTLVRSFSLGSLSSIDSEGSGEDTGRSPLFTDSSGCSSNASSPRRFNADGYGDGDDTISLLSIYSVASSSADKISRSLLPKNPPKTPERTFSDVKENPNAHFSVERGGFLRPSYGGRDLLVEDFTDDDEEMSFTPPLYVSGSMCDHKVRPKQEPRPPGMIRTYNPNQRSIPRDLTTAELPLYFPEYYLTEPDEYSTPVTPPGQRRPLRTDSSEMMGRLLRAKTPEQIAYSWQEFGENKKPVAEKLLLYKTEKEATILQNAQPASFDFPANFGVYDKDRPGTSSTNRSGSAASSRAASAMSDIGQTVEDYLRAIRLNKTEWSKEDRSNTPEMRKIRRKLMEGSYPVSTVNENKLPKLLRFTWKGKHTKLEQYLAKKKKSVGMKKKINIQDQMGRTALHMAASWADYRSLKLLLKVEGIDLNVKDAHDKTPLFKAIEMQSLACVRLLVQAGAKARVTCRDGRNALEYAITEFGDECYSIIEYLYCARGIRDVDMATRHMNLLHQVTLAKRHVSVDKVIRMIFDSGAEREPMEGNLRTPLILAAMQDRPDIVYTLLLLDCDLNHYDAFTKAAFHYAKKDSECFKIMMGVYDNPEGGPRVFNYRPSDKNAAVEAIKIEDSNEIGLLRGPSPNRKNKKKQDGPFNLNPKTADPEYRKHITNLFLASKFKEELQQQQQQKQKQ